MERETILVLSGSPRQGGNSDLLADEFVRGVREAGGEAVKIRVAERTIRGCAGCGVCQGNGGVCVQRDDMSGIYDGMRAAGAIVLACPVYFYGFNAQMKAVMDRTYALIGTLRDKTFYLLAACGASGGEYTEALLAGFRGYVNCFEGAREGGHVFAYGTGAPGSVRDNPAMARAYDLGKAAARPAAARGAS